jgi:hypothetical protein
MVRRALVLKLVALSVTAASGIAVRCRTRRQPFRRRRRAARGPGFVDGRSKLDVAVPR